MEFEVSFFGAPFCLREKHHLLSAWTWHLSHAHVTFPWPLSGRAGGAAATQGVRSVYGSDQALTSALSLEVSGPSVLSTCTQCTTQWHHAAATDTHTEGSARWKGQTQPCPCSLDLA